MNPLSLIQQGVVAGLVIGLVAITLIFTSQRLDPEIWYRDYPTDIQQKYGPPKPASQRWRKLIALLLLTLFIGVAVFTIRRAFPVSLPPPRFSELYLLVFTIFFTFNLFDAVVVDWLVFMIIKPKWMLLPGIEIQDSSRYYGKLWRGFFIGTVISLAGALLVAGIAWAILRA